MNIEYFEPMNRAFARMKQALFNPFDIGKWFAVGFTAWLAGLLDGGGSGGNWGDRHRGGAGIGDIMDGPGRAWDWLVRHPGWFLAIGVIVLVVIAVIITLTWLSSRGVFMFLHNVIHDRKEVGKPWREFKEEGNSLFLWRLAFGFICFAAIVLFLIFAFSMGYRLYHSGDYTVPVGFIVLMVLVFILLIVIMSYISLFLKDFVAPLMYKYRIKTTEAWSRFLELFREHVGHFLLYGIFVTLAIILAVILLLMAGVLTCCVGLVLLILPYIGTVVSLPVWYTFRAFSLEYLAQYGDDYTLFPPKVPDAEAPQAATA